MSAKRSPLRLRRGQPRDLDALCTLEEKVFQGDRVTRRGFRNLLASSSAELIVTGLAHDVSGYALTLFRANSRVARLYSLAVTPSAAGSGIGAALLAAAENAARRRGCAVLRLEVAVRNKRAARLYARAGYGQIGQVADYYEDGSPALRFEKLLTGTANCGRAGRRQR